MGLGCIITIISWTKAFSQVLLVPDVPCQQTSQFNFSFSKLVCYLLGSVIQPFCTIYYTPILDTCQVRYIQCSLHFLLFNNFYDISYLYMFSDLS